MLHSEPHNALIKASTSAGVQTERVDKSGSIRRTRPVSTRPDPISATSSTSAVPKISMLSRHRTIAVICPTSWRLISAGSPIDGCRQVGNERHQRRAQRHPIERLLHDRGSRRHQRGMKGCADRKNDRPTCAVVAGDHDRPLDGAPVTADDDLRRGIVVRDRTNLVRLAMLRLRGDRPRRLDVETEQSSHRPLAERDGLLHRPSAEFDEARRIADRDRACCRQGRVFAEGMTRDIGDMPAEHEPAFRLEHPNHREARRQQRGLGVFGQDEIAFRPFEHQRERGAATAPRRLPRRGHGPRERLRRGCAPCRPPATPGPERQMLASFRTRPPSPMRPVSVASRPVWS